MKDHALRTLLPTTFLCVIGAAPALAHEMWLQPSAFTVKADEPAAVAFFVGDAADITPWKINWDKLHSFRSFGPEGVQDQQATITMGTAMLPAKAVIRWHRAGTHMLAMESYHQSIELPAAKYNAYIKEDGLTAAIDQRQRTRTTGKPGREIYSRRTKALIQVGDTITDEALQPIGQTLEIVPERNPYAPGAQAALPVRIMFEGRPLSGALVALTPLGTGSKPVQSHISDAAGHAAFDVPRSGSWMVSVVWTRPMQHNPDADYDTIFASLSFGY